MPRGYRWPPDFSASPQYVPFSSSRLFGNRSERLAAPHTQDIRMTRMVRFDQAQNLNKGPGAYKPSVDHTTPATKKIWLLVLTQADGAPSTRVIITCARQGLHFGANKTENKKGAHMQKGGSQPSPIFLFMYTFIDSPHAFGILSYNFHKPRSTVDSCDLKKVDMTAAPKDAPTEVHCSERHLVDTRTSGSFLSRLCF